MSKIVETNNTRGHAMSAEILEGVEVRQVNSLGIAYGPWMIATDTDAVYPDVANAIADEIAEDTGVNVVTVGGQTYKFRHISDAE